MRKCTPTSNIEINEGMTYHVQSMYAKLSAADHEGPGGRVIVVL